MCGGTATVFGVLVVAPWKRLSVYMEDVELIGVFHPPHQYEKFNSDHETR